MTPAEWTDTERAIQRAWLGGAEATVALRADVAEALFALASKARGAEDEEAGEIMPESGNSAKLAAILDELESISADMSSARYSIERLAREERKGS